MQRIKFSKILNTFVKSDTDNNLSYKVYFDPPINGVISGVKSNKGPGDLISITI